MDHSHTLFGALLFVGALVTPVPQQVVLAGDNPDVVLPLHARVGIWDCTGFQPVNCTTVRPTVNVPPNTQVTIYLLMNRYQAVTGAQTAFEWDPSWVLLEYRCCQPFQACDQEVGSNRMNFANEFPCIPGPALAAIGHLWFVTGSGGCFAQVQSDHPFGTHVLDCHGGRDSIDANSPNGQRRLGKVCVAGGGYDACDGTSPVEPETWGAIKASYE